MANVREARDEEYAARRLGVTKSTLRHWRSAGLGPDFVKHGAGRGGRVVYFDEDLDDYIERHRREPYAERGVA